MEARIIIVGSGFAGVTLAKYLTCRVVRDVEVMVISSDNHMVFTPMLAELVGRSLSPLDVVMPGRQMAPRATWLTATVNGVDLNKHRSNAAARRLLFVSIIHLPLLFVLMMLDKI